MLKVLLWAAAGALVLALLLAVMVALLFQRANVTNGQIESSGEKRAFLLYVPPSYDPSRPAPLVISIHGYAEWPAHQRDISRWNDLADREGFLVVYPSGTGFPLRWRTTGEAGTSSDPQLEVTFISDLIDHLEGVYNIDPGRIYANGLSNGGGMSYVLGCKLSERLAAIGSVSGAYLFPLEECRPSRPVPMIAFHGTADEIVPYEGGPSGAFDLPFPAIEDWILQRALKNGCDGNPVTLLSNPSIRGIQYAGCVENADVVLYTIELGGHAWPGGDPMPEWIVGYTTQEIDATGVMWQFFQEHAHRNVSARGGE